MKTEIDIYIGNKIREARRLRGLTQKDLIREAKLPTTQQVFSKYENGGVRVPAGLLYTLAIALRMEMEFFFPRIRAKMTKEEVGRGKMVAKLSRSAMIAVGKAHSALMQLHEGVQ